jgi:uroporphyrin-III C-methyltransferase
VTRPVAAGHVYLVGAGPGDPELLTVRAAAVLAAADAVFHDRLVGEEVLALAPPRAVRVDVGHRAGGTAPSPAGVAALMAAAARAGLVAVRLKGGDPFVFGRGGEEAQALRALGAPYEVVPGITSALAGPAAAGIPVTHRGLASSVAIVTARERDPRRTPPWELLRADTVVVLMGAGRLGTLAGEMAAAGWDPATPAAVVSEATRPAQRSVTGRLDDIAGRAELTGLRAPAILVVGGVVALAGELAPWAAATCVGTAR